VIRTKGAELPLAALLVALAPGCRTPTEITIDIVADVAHRPDMAVSVQLDSAERIEESPPRLVTTRPWTAGTSIGTVVAIPSGARDDVAVRVVLATGRDPSACSAHDASGCILVRRRLRFTRGESTRARIVLRPACMGVFCDAASSCSVDGTCGSLDSDEGGDGGAPDEDAAGTDPYSAAVIADRPRHYYRLDEPEGATAATDAMGRADGTYEGGVKLGVTGALATSENPGAFFDGAGAAVIIPRAEDLPGAFTVEAWVRSDAIPSAPATIVERLDLLGVESYGYRLTRPPDAIAAFEVFRGTATARAAVQSLRFAGYLHVAAVTRGGSIEVYVDGAKTSAPLPDAPVSTVVGPLSIGGSRSGALSFRGAIDEVAIYDYPLEPAQIARHIEAAGPREWGP
jgi:hypothetical protein